MLKRLLLIGALVALPLTAHAAKTPPAKRTTTRTTRTTHRTTTRSTPMRLSLAAGPRLGFSSNPDQVVLGGQLTVTGFAPSWSLEPSLELGFGDNATVIAFNADALYHLRISGSDWSPHLGFGLQVANASVNRPFPFNDVTSTNAGMNAIFGFSVPMAASSRWFTDLRLGIGSVPDMKLVGGINFHL